MEAQTVYSVICCVCVCVYGKCFVRKMQCNVKTLVSLLGADLCSADQITWSSRVKKERANKKKYMYVQPWMAFYLSSVMKKCDKNKFSSCIQLNKCLVVCPNGM